MRMDIWAEIHSVSLTEYFAVQENQMIKHITMGSMSIDVPLKHLGFKSRLAQRKMKV